MPDDINICQPYNRDPVDPFQASQGIDESAAGAVSQVALAGVAGQEKTPYVAGFSIADPLTGKFCNPYVARTSFSANALQPAAGRYWADQGVKTAVFMGPD